MAEGRNCCGFSPGAGPLKVLFLCCAVFPFYAACLLLSLVCSVPGRSGRGRCWAALFAELARVSLAVINDSMAQRLRCAMASGPLVASPRLAGLAYRYFNPLAILCGWCAALATLGTLR